MLVNTDYLVVGAGASGLAFADALVAEADVEVTVIDRQRAPGGHWLHAYPFVRLHSPSAYYGVNSLALGEDRIDEVGENAGFYERATGDEVREYFAEAAARLTQTGRVRMLTGHEHLGRGANGEQVRDLSTGELHDVAVRRKVVDARYLEASVPATHAPSFDVASGARVVPVNDLPAAAGSASSYTVLGSGKTAVDACTWLLDNDVEPDRIRWIRPRDAWFYDRADFQPLEQVGAIMEGISLDAEAGAQAARPRGPVRAARGLGALRRASTRRGRRRCTAARCSAPASSRPCGRSRTWSGSAACGGSRPTGSCSSTARSRPAAEVLHVDCTALGLSNAPATPIFQPGRIVLQQVRHLSPCFNAALIGFVEAHRDDDVDKNRLCPPNPYASSIEDWPRMMSRTWRTEMRWLSEPDLSAWVAESRLNLLRGLPDHTAEPSVQAALKRYLTHVGPAIERLKQLDGSGAPGGKRAAESSSSPASGQP